MTSVDDADPASSQPNDVIDLDPPVPTQYGQQGSAFVEGTFVTGLPVEEPVERLNEDLILDASSLKALLGREYIPPKWEDQFDVEPKDLSRRDSDFGSFVFDGVVTDVAHPETAFLRELKEDMDLCKEMIFSHVVFEGTSVDFRREVSKAITQESVKYGAFGEKSGDYKKHVDVYLPHTSIAVQGSWSTDLYFVWSGTVDIYVQESWVRSLHEGESTGQLNFCGLSTRMEYSLRAGPEGAHLRSFARVTLNTVLNRTETDYTDKKESRPVSNDSQRPRSPGSQRPVSKDSLRPGSKASQRPVSKDSQRPGSKASQRTRVSQSSSERVKSLLLEGDVEVKVQKFVYEDEVKLFDVHRLVPMIVFPKEAIRSLSIFGWMDPMTAAIILRDCAYEEYYFKGHNVEFDTNNIVIPLSGKLLVSPQTGAKREMLPGMILGDTQAFGRYAEDPNTAAAIKRGKINSIEVLENGVVLTVIISELCNYLESSTEYDFLRPSPVSYEVIRATFPANAHEMKKKQIRFKTGKRIGTPYSPSKTGGSGGSLSLTDEKWHMADSETEIEAALRARREIEPTSTVFNPYRVWTSRFDDYGHPPASVPAKDLLKMPFLGSLQLFYE